jgi:hypothetical protein
MATGAFCLVRQESEEHSPSGILDGLGEYSSSQALNVKVLESDEIETINEFPRFLVGEVFALSGNAFVDASNAAHGFPTIAASFTASGEAALGAFQLPLGYSEVSGVRNFLAVVECSEGFQSHIDADGEFERNFQRRDQAIVNDDLGEPAGNSANDAKNFLLADDALIPGAELHQSQLRDVQQIAGTDIGASNKAFERVVACVRTEARKTSFLASRTTPKECLEAAIHAAKGITGELHRNGLQRRHPLAQAGEKFTLPIVGERFTASLVRFDALFETAVVYPATHSQPRF